MLLSVPISQDVCTQCNLGRHQQRGEAESLSRFVRIFLLSAAHPCAESQGSLQIRNVGKAKQSKTSLEEMRKSVVGGFQEQISQAPATDCVRGSEVPFPEPLVWALWKTTLLLQGFPSLTAIPSSQKHA